MCYRDKSRIVVVVVVGECWRSAQKPVCRQKIELTRMLYTVTRPLAQCDVRGRAQSRCWQMMVGPSTTQLMRKW